MNEESKVYEKILELINRNGIIDGFLSRPLNNFFKQENKSQNRLCDDPNRNLYDFVMNGEEITLQGDNLIFEGSGKTFFLRR